jgi:tetratricopeptide (TPR) repeat protein
MDHSPDSRSRNSLIDRLRPQQILKWAAYVLVAAGLAAGAVYWVSIPSRAQHSYEEARRYYEVGRYANALLEANDALRGRGLRLQAYRLRADIYRALQQPDKAAGDISRVIEMEPGIAEHYAFRANAYMEMGDAARAILDYTRITELRRTARAFGERGRAYLKLKDTTKAIEDFTTAIGLEPTLENYLERGQAYAAIDDHDKAMADFDQALEAVPDHDLSAAYGYRARAAERRRTGDIAGADEDLFKATALESKLEVTRSPLLSLETEVTADRAKPDATKKEEAAAQAAKEEGAKPVKPARKARGRRARAH